MPEVRKRGYGAFVMLCPTTNLLTEDLFPGAVRPFETAPRERRNHTREEEKGQGQKKQARFFYQTQNSPTRPNGRLFQRMGNR